MSSLSEDQISEHKEAFMLFDRRGDGKIESAQLGEVLRSLGLNPTQADVKKVLNEVDPKGNKRISFEEFLPIFLSIGQKKPIHSSNEGFVDGLRVFDREGNGQISAAELRHVLTGLANKKFHFLKTASTVSITNEFIADCAVSIQDCGGERMTDEEVDLLVSGQEDQQGQINYEEFVKMVMSG